LPDVVPAKMWSDNLFHNFWGVAFLVLRVCLCSCEGGPVDRDSKEIAHGHRSERMGNPSQFDFLAAYDTGLKMTKINRKVFNAAARFEIWSLKFVWDLAFGIWKF